MRTTWSSETTKAADYTVVRCLCRCHRYKTNYIKEVTPCCQTRTPKTPIFFFIADMLKDLLAQELITEKDMPGRKVLYEAYRCRYRISPLKIVYKVNFRAVPIVLVAIQNSYQYNVVCQKWLVSYYDTNQKTREEDTEIA